MSPQLMALPLRIQLSVSYGGKGEVDSSWQFERWLQRVCQLKIDPVHVAKRQTTAATEPVL